MLAQSMFGSLVRKYRQECGLTLEQLARRVKKKNGVPVSAAYLSLLENRRKPPPSEPIIRALEGALGTPAETLAEARDGHLQIRLTDLLKRGQRGRRIVRADKKIEIDPEILGAAIQRMNEFQARAKLRGHITTLPASIKQKRGEVKFKIIMNAKGGIEELYALRVLSGESSYPSRKPFTSSPKRRRAK